MKRKTLRRLPAFVPVPVRRRTDGWTPWRQAAFLGYLAQTGSVRSAAERVGLTRESAYRLRRRAEAESFAAAWDQIVWRLRSAEKPPKRKFTHFELFERAFNGTLRPILYRRQFRNVAQESDIKAFYRLVGSLLLARSHAPNDRSDGQN